MTIVLGIETSCDETSAAIVNDKREVLSNKVLSQIAQHTPYGGVVPEIAAREHIKHLDNIIKSALEEAKLDIMQIDAIAATVTPGLIGGLIVGMMTGKAIAAAAGKKFIPINHLEGHALTVRLTNDIEFPYLLLLVSGGHCQFRIIKGVGDFEVIGTTLDDAAGEAFDKVAKMLQIGFPGGPAIEKAASLGNHLSYDFPLTLKNRDGCDFSFSGLKTAVRILIDKNNDIKSNCDFKNNVAASFQYTVGEIICNRMKNAVEVFKKRFPDSENVVLAGGVAANQYLRRRITKLLEDYSMNLVVPPPSLCTDNAAMIAWVGIETLAKNLAQKLPD